MILPTWRPSHESIFLGICRARQDYSKNRMKNGSAQPNIWISEDDDQKPFLQVNFPIFWKFWRSYLPWLWLHWVSGICALYLWFDIPSLLVIYIQIGESSVLSISCKLERFSRLEYLPVVDNRIKFVDMIIINFI